MATKPKKKTTTVKAKGKTLTVTKQKADAVLDKGKVLKLYIEGKSQADIARQFGVTPSAVCQCITPYKDQLAELSIYQENRATWQDAAAHKILKAIMDKDLEDEKMSGLSGAYKVFHDSQRLQTGQSTQNVALKVVDLSRFANDLGENDAELDNET